MTATQPSPLTMVQSPCLRHEVDAVIEAGGTRRGRPVVVWDLDGALARSGTLLPFLRRVAGTAAVMRALTAAASWDLPHEDRRRAVRASLLQQILGGRPLSEVDRVARGYAARVVAGRLRPDALACWSAHHRSGHRLVLTSASPGLYLHHLGRHLGADAVICTEMTVVNGHLTGAIRGGDCHGAEKARRVLANLVEQPAGRVWAYASADADEPLLSIADIAIRVSAHRRLSCRAD